jgi:Photosynthetic reaction centre cytochrome C subunit
MRTRDICIAGALCVCLSTLLPGQQPPPPPGGAPPAAGGRAPQKPRNLKVLPEDADLRTIMRQYTGALGVECEFCHTAADPVTHRADRASDANPEKDKARLMIQMTDDLNKKYLTLIPDRHDNDAISCGTCHRGEKHPPAFIPPPRQQGARPPGAPGAGGGAAPPPPPPGN